MWEAVYVAFDTLITLSGRLVTALILPKSLKESSAVHVFVGYTLWIGAWIVVIVVVRSILS